MAADPEQAVDDAVRTTLEMFEGSCEVVPCDVCTVLTSTEKLKPWLGKKLCPICLAVAKDKIRRR